MVFRKFTALSLALALVVPHAAAAQSVLPRILYSRDARAPVNSPAFSRELLANHNVERRRMGVPALAWDPTLAEGA